MRNNMIGIDVGGTNLKVAWVEDNQLSSEIVERNTPYSLDEFRFVIKEILEYLNVNDETRIGLSVPGTVDYNTQRINLCPNLDYLNAKTGDEIMERRNILIGNDADMALLGEISVNSLWQENVALVALGTGIGSSYFINNIGPWQSNLMSEIGHIKVASNGRKCTCGGSDCLETYFSGWSLLAQAKKAGLEVENIEDLFTLIRNNNQNAINLFKQSITYLGIAISDLINLTGIEKIILSGKISLSYDFFHQDLNHAVANSVHPRLSNNFQIIKSDLINHAAIIGAVARFN